MSVISEYAIRAFHAVYPPLCMSCGAETAAANGLCPDCWSETEFIYDLACRSCGTPLIGEGAGQCEECFADPPPWDDGVAVLVYGPASARIVQALKHADRLDLVPKIGSWMADMTKPVVSPNAVVVPIPIHWRRLVKRKYNQADLLAREMASHLDLQFIPDGLVQPKWRPQQRTTKRKDRLRETNVEYKANPLRDLAGKHVILVDDVMTTGATLRAATKALQAAKVKAISISVFARVAPPQ